MVEIGVDLHCASGSACRGDRNLPWGDSEETHRDGHQNNRENAVHEREINSNKACSFDYTRVGGPRGK